MQLMLFLLPPAMHVIIVIVCINNSSSIRTNNRLIIISSIDIRIATTAAIISNIVVIGNRNASFCGIKRCIGLKIFISSALVSERAEQHLQCIISIFHIHFFLEHIVSVRPSASLCILSLFTVCSYFSDWRQRHRPANAANIH